MSKIVSFLVIVIFTNAQPQNGSFKLWGEKKLLPLMLTEAEERLGNARNQQNISLPVIDFLSLSERKSYLVDKTNFIADFLNDPSTHVMITRPQGFGKTLSHSMLYHFLNIKGNSASLFTGTNIVKAENRDVCKVHQNQHPVIRISFAELDHATTWEDAQNLFQGAFKQMLQDHYYLINEKPRILNDISDDDRKKWFDQITEAKSLTSPDPMIIYTLSKYVYNHFDKQVIVLMDDYDSPVHAAYRNSYYSKMISFYRPLLQSTLKDNPFINKTLILGVSRISKEDIFWGINYLESYPVVKSRYSSYFGFDKTETAQFVRGNQLDASLVAKMVRKYGGYRFGDHLVFNPYSVTQCLHHIGNLKGYWMDSKRKQDLVKLLNGCGFVPVLESEILLQKLLIDHVYDEKLAYSAVKRDLNALWALAVDFGYVTTAKKENEVHEKFKCQLEIPNEELSEGFHEFVDKYHTDHKTILPYVEWEKLVLAKNISSTLDYLKSYFDNALTYFAAERVEDPLAQMETLAKTLAQGLRNHYDNFDFRSVRKDQHGWKVSVDFRGGPKDIPIKMMFYYGDREKLNIFRLLRYLKSGLLISVCRVFLNFRWGRIVIENKVIAYLVMDSWVFYSECYNARMNETIRQWVPSWG